MTPDYKLLKLDDIPALAQQLAKAEGRAAPVIQTAERRTMVQRAGDFQTREDGGEKYIEGYFATFQGAYEMGVWGVERVDPHAFDETLSDDVRALVNHDTTLVLGRTRTGTLQLMTDERGLFGRIRINQQDQDAVNCYERVKRGDVSQCSFGFEILDELREDLPDGRKQWTLLKVRLYEVSVCTFPSYEDTEVSARARDLDEIKRRELDAWRADMMKKLKNAKEDN